MTDLLTHERTAGAGVADRGCVPARCRFCSAPLTQTFVDLGMSPLCQSHIEPEQLNRPETFYPLHVWVCGSCRLVQLEDYVGPDELFSEYAYFSSYSEAWVAHARAYTEQMVRQLGLTSESFAVEIASNDGYLLQHLAEAGVGVRGIEPAANVAAVAERRGVATTVAFFGRETARDFVRRHGRADLLLGNNVLAHVPDLNDFVAGMATLLADHGLLTMEFPHLQKLIEYNQFDTIYHEHFSYLSLTVVERIFAAHGLRLFDVEELGTHGGSLRIYVRHAGSGDAVSPRVDDLRAREARFGLGDPATYRAFGEQVERTKRDLLRFLIDAREGGRRVVGYGAPGKGNTLLNYCGIRTDLLEFTVDRSPHKQGRYTPGTHIPILAPEAIDDARPDYVLILPWNLQQEIQGQLGHIRGWGGRCVVPIPEVRVLAWPEEGGR